MSWATLFRRAADPEAFLEADEITWHQAVLQSTGTGPTVHDTNMPMALLQLLNQAEQWRDQASQQMGRLIKAGQANAVHSFSESTEPRQASEQALALPIRMLAASAPMGTLLGCWLQGMSAPGVFEDTIHLELLTLLADDMGAGQLGRSRSDAFRMLLQRCRLSDHATAPIELSFLPTIPDQAFALPAVLLAMSRRSDYFGPELCGIDLMMRMISLMPCWTALEAQVPQWIDWNRLRLSVAGDILKLANPLASAYQIAIASSKRDMRLGQRIQAGATWLLAALKAWNDLMLRIALQRQHPVAAMQALVQQKAREASAYHRHYRLHGCPLSERFVAAKADPAPLVQALAGSALVKPGASEQSALVTSLVGPRGKMFRIFTDDELGTMRRWIDALPLATSTTSVPADPSQTPPKSEPNTMPDATTSQAYPAYRAPAVLPQPDKLNGAEKIAEPRSEPAADPNTEQAGIYPRSLRDAYFVLQGRSLAPQTRRYAYQFVDAWMRRAKAVPVDAAETPLPAIWPEIGLREWLSHQHERSDQRFQANADIQIPIREEVIDSTLQLAPMLCIDGAWLQGFTDMQLASSEIGTALFQIYWDELGNGQHALNHPKIYRDLLRQMGVDLPPTGSLEFSQSSLLREASFRIPVLWLCLGKLPTTFLPEILGLNLSMELSGVGGGYRSAHRFLKHHGFSTHFVDLHNTIDNVATGHSAMAAEAVDRFCRASRRTLDDIAFTAQWHRICAGFHAMANPPSVDLGWLEKFRQILKPKAARARLPTSALHHHDWLIPTSDHETNAAPCIAGDSLSNIGPTISTGPAFAPIDPIHIARAAPMLAESHVDSR